MENFNQSREKNKSLKRAGSALGVLILATGATACNKNSDSGGDSGGAGTSPVTSVPFSPGMPTRTKAEKPACDVKVTGNSASIIWNGPHDTPPPSPVEYVSYASYKGGNTKYYITGGREEGTTPWFVDAAIDDKTTVTATATLHDGSPVTCHQWTGNIG